MTVGTKKDVETVVKALKANRFDPVEYVETADAATELVLDMIPKVALVGVASSTSIRQTSLPTRLRQRGTEVIDITAPSETPALELMRQTLRSDVLLVSSNSVTLDGKLVNIDGTGNRIGAMVFGPKRVIFIIGTNKIVKDIHEAVNRIKNVIAPYHAKIEGLKTPCAVSLRCTDCKSPERICNVTNIIEKKPTDTDVAIVLVGEDMGLGWHPDWDKERQERIARIYRETRKGFSSAIQSTPVEK